MLNPDSLRGDHYRSELPLGTFAEIQAQADADCPFCRLVVAAITLLRESGDQPEPSEAVEISWQLHPPGYSVNLAPSGTLIAFVQEEYPSGSESESSERGADGFWTTLAIQRVRPVSHDMGFWIPDWLENCQRCHGEQCEPNLDAFHNFARAGPGFKFRLIDVRAMAVVEFDIVEILAHALLRTTPAYAALSYVWGGVVGLRLLRDNVQDLRMPGSLHHHRSEIPRTVLDAIRLTKSMCVKYLWVDALCLVQDDPEDKARSIPRMIEVYAGATVTIVAASGPHANSGLPGVGDTPRIGKQIIEEVRPGLEMAVVNDVKDMLEASTYATRGWTFQEQLLANRTVIFTPDSSIYFRCLHSVWSEDTNDDSRPSVTTFEPDYLYMALGGSFPAALCYDALVLHYTDRSLTDQSDVLNAFAGMQKLLEKQLGTLFIQGIPPSAFDFFILFTGHWVVLKRRQGFPSWSWAGWVGKVRTDQREELQRADELVEWLDKRTWIRWYTVSEKGPGETEATEIWKLPSPVSGPKAAVSYTTRRPFDNRHCPDVKAHSVLPSTSSLIPPSVTTLRFWTLSVYFKIRQIIVAPNGPEVAERGDLVDKNGKLVGSVHLDDHFLAQQQAASSVGELAEPLEFIVLSEAKETQGGCALSDERGYLARTWDLYWVMLLTWNDGGVAERRGLGQVYQEAAAASFAPGPQWKEFALR
ncbi:heterokaryon incompatibility protein-domain-containing protein [Lasiosphaeris hirsuta]|uniref:Heterokaryon incompatibility protein-domain-containing protein n=1 Tax=Lasiosphaeris hirsuta TaxID=260670 RepID=A0AA39ZXU6_9PEZI|nr:heterokaryon incompatibility protein-domain-containing protein [Lasiosphaeris hirsuta]